MNTIREERALDDNSLIYQVTKGNQAALNHLLVRYQPKTERLVRQYIKCPFEALDVCQEIYIKLHRSLHQFKAESSFYTWYYMIVRNTIKNYLRQQKILQDNIINVEVLREEMSPLYLKSTQSPEALLIAEEAQKSLIQTLKEMPSVLCHCMLLFDVKGLSYEAIAKVMNCPIGTVRSRIYRARHLIEKNIAEIE